jgi:hypothetical protein
MTMRYSARHPACLTRLALTAAFAVQAFTAAAQTPCVDGAPGCYEPVLKEPGFSEQRDLSNVSFQANVNLYGGNLVVTATDVDLPSTGLFRLTARRTHNALRLPTQQEPNAAAFDSPMGLGWTTHLGVLWPVA